MTIQTILSTIVLMSLILFQNSLTVLAQDRNSTQENYRGLPIEVPDIPDLPTAPLDPCSKPQLIKCGEYRDHVEWTSVTPATGYSVELVYSYGGASITKELQPMLNRIPISTIANLFNIPLENDGKDLNLPTSGSLLIYIDPNAPSSCWTNCIYPCPVSNNELVAEYIDRARVCSSIPPSGEGAKGFAAIETDKRNNNNYLNNYTTTITPNPVQTNANITVDLAESNPLSINIYSANGQHIQEVVANNHMIKGLHHFNYDMGHLPTGVYYCRIQSGDQSLTKKIVKMD